MGQHVSNLNSSIVDLIKSTNNPTAIVFDSGPEDINLFLSAKVPPDTTNYESNSNKHWMKHIQTHLALLTDVLQLETINNIFATDVFISIVADYKRVIQEIKDIIEKKEQLKISLTNKFQEDKQRNETSRNKVASKTAVHYLDEELPIPSSNHHFAFESQENDNNQLSFSNVRIKERQVERFLLNLPTNTKSLKDILLVLNQLIFNKVDFYDVRNVFIEMNNHFKTVSHEWECHPNSNTTCRDDNNTTESKQPTEGNLWNPLTYLTSIGAFPNQQVRKLHKRQLTGELIALFVFTHLDIDSTIHSSKYFQSGSIQRSMSFEFHPHTFKQLFHIIRQLSTMTTDDLNSNLIQILIISLRLFTTHLTFLCAITTNLHRDLLATNENMKQSMQLQPSTSNKEINLSDFATDDELQTWIDTLLLLACNEHHKTEQTTLCREASKAIVYILNKTTSSFIEKLSFIHKYIVNNEHLLLVEQFLIELNTNAVVLSWIELLCHNDDNKSEKVLAFTILYSLIDIYLNTSNEMKTHRIQQILETFQQLVFVQLTSELELSRSFLMIKYIIYILNNSNGKLDRMNNLLNSILVGLSFMVKTDEPFNFAIIQQPLFTAILPLLAEVVLQTTNNAEGTATNLHYKYWLLGKMSHILIEGPPQDLLETKYLEKLKSPLFAGGCETISMENNRDLFESNIALYSHFKMGSHHQESQSNHEFLMSIYNNREEGAQLILKMKMHIKDKQRLLQKSIEQQVNDACAALFAVYIKYYRRINLAKSELSRMNDRKPHKKLLSLFENAKHVQTVFGTIKGQGGDCNELYEQIRIKTHFLLFSVKESDSIPIIEGITNEPTKTSVEKEKVIKFRRQCSRKRLEKNIFRLLRTILQACIRFKKLILIKKKAIEQKFDSEKVLRQAIDAYVYSNLSNDELKLQMNELVQCMSQQYQRAMLRLITYRFINKFIQKMMNIKDKNHVCTFLEIYLPYLRKKDIDWSYLENIPATNIQLKEEIAMNYYSIIETIRPYLIQSTTVEQTLLVHNMFHLLNLFYTSTDIAHIHKYGFLESLFKSFVSSVEIPDRITSLRYQLIGFDWFRLYVSKLCENFEIEESKGRTDLVLDHERRFVFHKLILNELKELKQRSTTDLMAQNAECQNNSFNNAAMGWFMRATTMKTDLSSKFEVELCINQWLMLLLRCFHAYEHLRSFCATLEYIDELLYIYRNSQNQVTSLLALKILRKLILLLPEKSDGTMKNLFNDILFSIGDHFISQRRTPDIITELIYIYRTIISIKSPWQTMAIERIVETMMSSLESFQPTNMNQMNNILASLAVLGGNIQPFCLGSIVEIYVGDEINNETRLGMIIDIDINVRDLGTSDVRPYLIQYSETNETEWVNVDKLRIDVDVRTPNLLTLPNANEVIHSLFDALAYLIEMNTFETRESLLLLQFKRRSIAALYRLLTNKKLVEIFMEKPYASIIAKLSTSDLLSTNHIQPTDLRLSNKQHLEQYCLSLDRCEYFKEILDNINESSFIIWNDVPFKRERLTMDSLSTNVNKDCEWKPNGSKKEIELFKRGRIGNDEIVIVPMPNQPSGNWILEECGTAHKFPGRTYLIAENANAPLVTFVVDNLRLSEGKWFYCVRLLECSFAQIGWATTGFMPSDSIGIGNDKYSWSYDKSQGILYNNGEYPFFSDDTHWDKNDVCGCGIEIDGDNTRIHYWLNGHFLGTAFAHEFPIGSSTTICDMLPNGRGATYFPGITLKINEEQMLSTCDFIFSPEDMFECPLPAGYKPLLLPKLVHIEHVLVAYPYSAYLIDDNNCQDHLFQTRNVQSNMFFLRDLVNDHHLETTLTFDNHQLILPKESNGFPLTIDHNGSFTIGFDFRILEIPNDHHNNNPVVSKISKQSSSIKLLTFDTPDTFSIEILVNEINVETPTAIVFHPNEQKIKVYVNNQCRTFECPLMTKFNLHILPHIPSGIRNLAIWKYALSEEHIRRLFTFGLSYVATDYQRIKEHRKQANRLTFSGNQHCFINECLVPMSQPFEKNQWEKVKKQADQNESNYFKSNQSTIQLFGNRTYLVLDKSINAWSQYTLVLDILIIGFPIKNEQLTLAILNSQSEIYISNDGRVCLSLKNGTHLLKTESILKLNEFVRLLISVQETSIKIYLNELLRFDANVDADQLTINDEHIDLFREQDLTKNTTRDDTLRIECKSITYVNRAMVNIDEQIQSGNYSFESLITLPYSIIAPSLILIGYDEPSIKSVFNENPATNIQRLDTMLRETNVIHHGNILSKFGSSIDKEKLKNLLTFCKFDTEDKIVTLADVLLVHWNDLQRSITSVEFSQVTSDKKWFHQAVNHLNINDSLTEWIRDKSMTIDEIDLTHQLLDLNQHVQQQSITTLTIDEHRKKIQKSLQYSHRQIPHQQYHDSRIACEHGLISIYAHYTILNMLRVWSNEGSNLFPLEKFGDCTFIVTLLRLLDYHYVYTRLHTDENIDQMSLLVNSILKVETSELLKHHSMMSDEIIGDTLQQKAPLLYHLQKDIVVQSIQFLSNPSLLLYDYGDESTIVDKQSMIKQPNLTFILKLVHLFVELVSNKSTMKQHEIDFLIPILFPGSLINVLFDLFLLSPMHQAKINILHLFSALIQSSKQFNLNKDIQYFIFNLFAEFPPNPTSKHSRMMKKFQVTIMDLAYLLFERQSTVTTKQFTFDFSRFSQTFHDLWMIVDVVNALTDRTKHTPFPEMFLIHSIVLLDDTIQLTRDDISESMTHFDTTADRQLMNFMHNNPLMNTSFTEFIQSLPTDSVPNPTYYKAYPSLWHIPAISIQTRAKIFYVFSRFLDKLVSIIDFGLFPGESVLTDKMLTAKSYILYPTKFQFLDTNLLITMPESDSGMPTVNFDIVRASISTDSGLNTMFNQAYEQLHNNAHITFRKLSEQLWLAQYLNMHSTDQGGPYRDSISCMCSDICSTRLPLFILCPNGRTNSGSNRDRWIPNVYPPNKSIPNRAKNQYRFIGQLMGMAIRNKHYLDLKFPSLLWKQLVRETVAIEDIESIDSQSFTMINEIETNRKSMNTDNDINDLLSNIFDELRFEVVSSAGQTYELVPDGKDIPITASNFNEYCSNYRQYRLNEFHRQIECIREGLYSVVPGYFLSLFTADEIEQAVCGKGHMDVELLKRNTDYGGHYSEDFPCIQSFWTVISEMFDEEQKKLFLKFVWGRCTLPSCDEDFSSNFQIDPYDDIPNGSVDGALPRAHTCAFVLDLPEYSTTDIMYTRLNYAITYCSSIDGDGNMNDAPVTTDFDSDLTADEQ